MKLTTAGESHGKGLFAILEGFPAGLKLDLTRIDGELARRRGGHGRGARQNIECDRVEFLSGVRDLVTLGSPLALTVKNRDYENWKGCMAPEGCDASARPLTAVRPGHADLAGTEKYELKDARNILERASARETAVRVAAGTVCRLLLEKLNIFVAGYVRSVGSVCDEKEYTYAQILSQRGKDLCMADAEKELEAIELIDRARAAGDTLGGVAELRVIGLKSGFGSCMTYEEKLDARLCAALMSVQAIKGVEVGLGFSAAGRFGSEVHDEIFAENGKRIRKTNRAGGIEGGMSNGEELVLHAAMKPIPTLMKGLRTVDIVTGEPVIAAAERSDVCAIAACETVLESVLCTALAQVVLERLGGDTVAQLAARYEAL